MARKEKEFAVGRNDGCICRNVFGDRLIDRQRNREVGNMFRAGGRCLCDRLRRDQLSFNFPIYENNKEGQFELLAVLVSEELFYESASLMYLERLVVSGIH